jgi:hypothetical protein
MEEAGLIHSALLDEGRSMWPFTFLEAGLWIAVTPLPRKVFPFPAIGLRRARESRPSDRGRR